MSILTTKLTAESTKTIKTIIRYIRKYKVVKRDL